MADTYESLKIPPHSVDAEQSVLGGLMLDNLAWVKIADKVQEEDFYRQDHRLIFRTLKELSNKGEPLDVITLSEHMKTAETLDDAGGLAYLATLAKDTPSAANIEAYAAIVREKSVLRQLIAVGTAIADMGFRTEGRDAKECVESAAQLVYELESTGGVADQEWKLLKKLMAARLEYIQEQSKNVDADGNPLLLGYATGFEELDKRWGGLEGGKVYIIAGRPKMGKTTLAQNVIEHIG
ncbi:unnamed protein product, partial [Cyprideis torosa]